jgi:hypothetical protein
MRNPAAGNGWVSGIASATTLGDDEINQNSANFQHIGSVAAGLLTRLAHRLDLKTDRTRLIAEAAGLKGAVAE